MMEEVSTMMAYDADLMEQMSEEEILACLVSETGPTFTVPSKKAKLKESRLQIMDGEGKDEDPVDKYLRENLRLQQTSLRLEQENDNLAHRLISSKVALRNALDTAEDRVDELCKDLAQTRHRLEATEEVMRHKEEETAMLKEVFRKELEKTEQDLKRSSGIITDYKQICSQLTNRLEEQQSSHREELDSIRNTVKVCSHCQHVLATAESSIIGGRTTSADAETHGQRTTERDVPEGSEAQNEAEQKKEEQENDSLKDHIRELEKELAQTKLQLVESKCKIQELQHQQGMMANQLQETKNSWINKAFTSLRTSNGGLQALSLPRDGAPSLGWNLHGGSLSEKMLSWRLGENRVTHSLDIKPSDS
ncbi:rab GTPase-activating protein 1-like [Cynoglossus semilaevis]|uniref:RAB GTPase activating protein 1-like 2 n=1 Tax=Cynoglossus semilaevis TaxID=244447 RepID=A0A3P8V786_CYNSE|nr:rab GTPase-activating protein 1-like [Cynoglossus semilaevis]